jgi:hypothetical protein
VFPVRSKAAVETVKQRTAFQHAALIAPRLSVFSLQLATINTPAHTIEYLQQDEGIWKRREVRRTFMYF